MNGIAIAIATGITTMAAVVEGTIGAAMAPFTGTGGQTGGTGIGAEIDLPNGRSDRTRRRDPLMRDHLLKVIGERTSR